ncbi:MAG: hypothetical protein ACLFQY_19450, partial [Desulfococcaceae bacterium]
PFAGIIVPLLTPLTSGDKVDKPVLRALTRHCLDGPVERPLFIGKTVGLGPLLCCFPGTEGGALNRTG